MLICFEGVNRGGKSTQIEILKKKLNAETIHFPTRETTIGKACYKFLEDGVPLSVEEHYTLMLANQAEYADYLNSFKGVPNKYLIMDRSYISTILYSLLMIRLHTSNDSDEPIRARSIISKIRKTIKILNIPQPDYVVIFRNSYQSPGKDKYSKSLRTTAMLNKLINDTYSVGTGIYGIKNAYALTYNESKLPPEQISDLIIQKLTAANII